MWPNEFEADHEYRLAAALLGRQSARQLAALEALMGHPLTHAELASRIQGKGSRAVVTNAVKALRGKGLVRSGLMPDLKTPVYELTHLGARVLLVAHEQLPHRLTYDAFARGMVPAA